MWNFFCSVKVRLTIQIKQKVTVINRDNLLLEMYGDDYSIAFKNQDSKLVDELKETF